MNFESGSWKPSAGGFTGSRLEFPVRGVPAVMKNLQGTRRARERLPIDATVNLRRADGTKALSRISDVSATGMRLSGLPFLLNVGEELPVEILGVSRTQMNLGKGRVVWVRMQEAGLQVADPDTGQVARRTLLARAEAFRNTTADQSHPKSCPCRHGERPPEPPLSNIAARK